MIYKTIKKNFYFINSNSLGILTGVANTNRLRIYSNDNFEILESFDLESSYYPIVKNDLFLLNGKNETIIYDSNYSKKIIKKREGFLVDRILDEYYLFAGGNSRSIIKEDGEIVSSFFESEEMIYSEVFEDKVCYTFSEMKKTNVYCRSVNSVGLLWAHHFDDTFEKMEKLNNLLLVTTRRNVHCIDVLTGEIRWSSDPENPFSNLTCIYPKSGTIITRLGKRLVELNAIDRKEIREIHVFDDPVLTNSYPVFYDEDNIYYRVSNKPNNTIGKLSIKNQMIEWEYEFLLGDNIRMYPKFWTQLGDGRHIFHYQGEGYYDLLHIEPESEESIPFRTIHNGEVTKLGKEHRDKLKSR